MRNQLLRLAARTGSALLLAALATGAWAEEATERIRRLEQQLQESLGRIEALSARIADLERALHGKSQPRSAAAPTPKEQPPSATAEPPAPTPALPDDSSGTAHRMAWHRAEGSGLQLHGFADIGAAWSSSGDPQRRRGFNVGTLDLYAAPQIGDRVRTLVELALEYNDHEGLVLDLERIQLGYTVSDGLTLWGGRFHTPFGWWNNAYHHGAQLQPSISRPRFLEFEDRDGVLPVHAVGLWASGKVRMDSGALVHETYLANTPRIRERSLHLNIFTDDKPQKMFGGAIGFEPNGPLSGLRLGVHGFGMTVNGYAGDGTVFATSRVRMAGGYFVYESGGMEAVGEFYRFRNRDGAGQPTRGSHAWFFQVGRSIEAWTPFLRAERMALDANDPYFTAQRGGRPYRQWTFGARYALGLQSTLKFELSHTADGAALLLDESGLALPFSPTRYRRAAMQYTVAF